MRTALRALVAFVMLEHAGILCLEMFAWRSPLGLRVFRLAPAQAEASATLAANQGLYNGFLAAGLLWSLLAAPDRAPALMTFFLGCVVAAGVYGGATVRWRVALFQGGPAALALLLLRLRLGRA